MPDFGIFRGFNDKLFGNKLYAGQLPTQLGLIGSESFGIDADAQAFFNRVIAAGGTLSATEQNAVNQLVLDMKSYSIWTKMKAIYPMVGASADACKQNLKSSSFTGSFSSGWTFASTGVTGNGSSAYMDTSIIPSTSLSLNNTHISVYVRTNINTGCAIGNTTNDNGTDELSLYPRLSGLTYVRVNAASNNITTSTDSRAMHIGSRISSTQIKYYKNSSSFSLSNNSNSLSTSNLIIGAIKIGSSFFNYFSGQIAFSSIGDGLSDSEASDFYTAVQAFQTTLSRQV